MQSYLEDNNERLNSDLKVFKWLVYTLSGAIRGEPWRGRRYQVIDVLKVAYNYLICLAKHVFSTICDRQ